MEISTRDFSNETPFLQSIIENMISCEDTSQQQLHFLQVEIWLGWNLENLKIPRAAVLVASGGLQGFSQNQTAMLRMWSSLSTAWRLWLRLACPWTRRTTSCRSTQACSVSAQLQSAPTSSSPPPSPAFLWPPPQRGKIPTQLSDTNHSNTDSDQCPLLIFYQWNKYLSLSILTSLYYLLLVFIHIDKVGIDYNLKISLLSFSKEDQPCHNCNFDWFTLIILYPTTDKIAKV